MNARLSLASAFTLGLVAIASAGPILLSDTFSGTSLDTFSWSPTTPFSDSSVTVSGDNLVLDNRGRVLTTASFSNPFQVDFGFEITGSDFDSFKIVLRTDGTTTNGSAEFDSGLFASFRIRSDPSDPAGTSNNVALFSQNYPVGGILLGTGTFAFNKNQFYDVRILDTGTNVNLYINDFSNPFLTAATSASYGNQIGFYNREGAGAGSFISSGSEVKINSFSVAAVPDTGATVIYLGVSCLALIRYGRRRSVCLV